MVVLDCKSEFWTWPRRPRAYFGSAVAACCASALCYVVLLQNIQSLFMSSSDDEPTSLTFRASKIAKRRDLPRACDACRRKKSMVSDIKTCDCCWPLRLSATTKAKCTEVSPIPDLRLTHACYLCLGDGWSNRNKKCSNCAAHKLACSYTDGTTVR